MRRIKAICFIGSLLLAINSFMLQAQTIDRVEPLSWWTGMKTPLTLMFHGSDLADAQVTVVEKGLVITGTHNAESKNYIFVDVTVEKAGNYTFILQKGRKKVKYTYVINERNANSANRQSFDSKDVFYLIVPDRFANGNAENDSTVNTAEKPNRTSAQGRHGGDLQGIIGQLDYIAGMGATTIWCTPLLLDNEPTMSYHGYACADYYHIDPRIGDNELYRTYVEESHKRQLKVVMDIVTNHCGGAHWWMKDLPFHDWVHQFDAYTPSNYVFSANMDINASRYDLNLMESGWFDTCMPDMNLDNPYLLQYFKQWAVWWIEYAGLDGLRVDTYPYNEKRPMSEWCKAVRAEYPNLNIVGEVWTTPASQVAYWEADANNSDGFNSNLPSVMDFPTQQAICQALSEDGKAWNGGLTRIYHSLASDYLYNDPRRLLVFTGNHDTERIGDIVKDADPRRAKLAATLVATLRGVPQLLYGEEIMLRSANLAAGHGGLRADFPGNWPNEVRQLTNEQAGMLKYYTALFGWRKTEPIIHEGKTLHFFSRDNTYAYFRYTDQGAVFVFLNASDDDKNIPWELYSEITNKYHSVGKNVLTGEVFDTAQTQTVKALSSVVIKLDIPK